MKNDVMKYIKARKDFVKTIHPLLLLLGFLLFCFFPNIVLNSFYGFWLATGCAVWLILASLGNQRLAYDTDDVATRLSFSQWITCILLLQLTLFGVYWGMCFVSGELFVINTSIHSQLFSHSISSFLIQHGLFPWSLYAMIAVGMGVLSYKKEINAYFSNILFSLFKQDPQESWGMIINISARRCTLLGLSIIILFMTFLMIAFFVPLKNYIAFGFKPMTLLTTVILLLLSTTQFIKKYFSRIFSRSIPTALSFPVFALLFGLAILILSGISHEATLRENVAQQPVAAPDIITLWIQYHWQTAWMLFSMLWWLSLTPIMASYLTRISKGYRIRDVLLGVLAPPFVIALFLHFSQYLQTALFTFPPLAIAVIAFISSLILLPLLVNHHYSSNAIHAYFPKRGEIKPRDHQPFFEKMAQLVVVFSYFYLVIGINGVSILFVSLNYLIIPFFMLAIISIIIEILRSCHIPKQNTSH
ncbi:MAG: hypothetical protein A3C44_00405 [Gammaproteobacteria bacterium RIFCSPHIGHO2_02_FULL_39_13]|nr:MAG: hypothetical protein A3C44_00405 [Gammaproteobacteria bacterium RIFCSPHIGHO2_02_FULL_39_13]OGT48687.1 MAG: hypothetical protein A3E53_05375 [Gammaproteobacteria bacterium RIFCSPHIGHO2_12_FULL_39_24]